MELLNFFPMMYLAEALPDYPLYKNVEKKLRPPGVQNPLVRTWHREIIKFNKLEIVNVESHPEFVAVQIDLQNSFNAFSRAA